MGPRSRREAKRLALHLVSVCQVICSAAAGLGKNMDTSLPGAEDELVRHVVEACQNAIGLAVAQPSQAIGLAQALQSALTSLQLVQNEVAKGDAGASAVTSNADALARGALKEVLNFASLPGEALAAMAAVERVAPDTAERRNDPPPAVRPKAQTKGVLPLFSVSIGLQI
ncbi:hypothetical protein [Bradyrhizobium sp. CB1015]|uniref:hypothetical protein n=1 Tax=Bradyrhizobium sp. CB1015 TaxID=2976822 RepID=UPI0021AA8DD6|nr:hypothetical protein [Bradyrhizobium sp. CB1015]UWU92912.1 hypothetical protein N2604_02830 [Bradyrhizobium sp. CB1015]